MLIPRKVLDGMGQLKHDRGCMATIDRAVEIKRQPDGTARLTATNGNWLVTTQWAEADAKDYPGRGFNLAQVKDFKALLPTGSLAGLAKLAPKRSTIPILQNVCLEEGSANGEIRCGGTDLDTTQEAKIRTEEGEYPRWELVLPQPVIRKDKSEVQPVTVCLDAAYVMELCKVLATIRNHGKQNAIRFTLYPEANGTVYRPVKITTKSDDGADVTAILMPMRDDCI